MPVSAEAGPDASESHCKCSELVDAMSKHFEQKYLSRKDGERLRGRLQFAGTQVSGNVAMMAYKQLSRHVLAGGGQLDDGTQAAVLTLRDQINFAPPRCINARVLTNI